MKRSVEFKSNMKPWERGAALIYLVFHLLILPSLVLRFTQDMGEANFLLYAVGGVFAVLVLGGYLRRDFDPLVERLIPVFFTAVGTYLVVMVLNTPIALLLNQLLGELNPNNEDAVALEQTSRSFAAAAVFLAPIIEEVIFRGALFGGLRERNRVLAYVVGILAFSLYHVWGYAFLSPKYLIYALQYVPASWLLCRAYETTGTIWAPIFAHMLINGVSTLLAGG